MRAVLSIALVLAAAAGCGSPHRSACPTTRGHVMRVPLLGRFAALGKLPVGMDVANRGDLRRGRVILGRIPDSPGWLYVKAVWFTPPSFFGGFTVRVKRLDGNGAAGMGSTPPGGTFVAPAGPAPNMSRGWRDFPSGTWVKTPGCYAWTVSGKGFGERIVVDALRS